MLASVAMEREDSSLPYWKCAVCSLVLPRSQLCCHVCGTMQSIDMFIDEVKEDEMKDDIDIDLIMKKIKENEEDNLLMDHSVAQTMMGQISDFYEAKIQANHTRARTVNVINYGNALKEEAVDDKELIKIESMEKEMSALKSDMEKMKTENIAMKSEMDGLKDENEKLRKENEELRNKPNDKSDANKTNLEKIHELEMIIQALEVQNQEMELLKVENNEMKENIAGLTEENEKLKMENHELQNVIKSMKEEAEKKKDIKSWDEHDVLLWILNIDNGLFEKYKHDLEKEIIESQISGLDLFDCDINDIARFGIKKFSDRKILQRNIQKLKEKHYGKSEDVMIENDNEGNDATVYV